MELYRYSPPICLRGMDTGNFAFASTGIKIWDIAGLYRVMLQV